MLFSISFLALDVFAKKDKSSKSKNNLLSAENPA